MEGVTSTGTAECGNMQKSLLTSSDADKAAVAAAGAIPPLVQLLICGSYGPLTGSSTSGGIAPDQ
jgi:hypothetical protein